MSLTDVIRHTIDGGSPRTTYISPTHFNWTEKKLSDTMARKVAKAFGRGDFGGFQSVDTELGTSIGHPEELEAWSVSEHCS